LKDKSLKIEEDVKRLNLHIKNEVKRLDLNIKDEVTKLDLNMKDEVKKLDLNGKDEVKKLNLNMKDEVKKLDLNIKELKVDVGKIQTESENHRKTLDLISLPIILKVQENKKVQEKEQSAILSQSILLRDNEHVKVLISWVGKGRKWQLLYRGTRDGDKFHNKCDNKGATITLIQSSTGHLFGGYTPSPWCTKNAFVYDQRCFIFTLSNPNNINPTKFSHKPGDTHKNSIYDATSYGPTFGENDIYSTYTLGSFNFPHTYEDTSGYGNNTFTGSSNFQMKEIEVFAL